MSNVTIQKFTLQFLKDLKKNNDREWFNTNKLKYYKAQENVETFCDQLIIKMNKHDRIETSTGKKSLYRIYNDVRFSKDKSPYSPRFAGYLKREKPMLRGGYYFWIKPGASRIGCGFTYPSSQDLKRIRMDMVCNHKDWERLLNLKSIKSNFSEMRGDRLKTVPRDFSQDHPAIDLLRYKQYWFEHPFSDKDVIATDFMNRINSIFKSIRPFFDYTSELLTTDMNGESIV